MRRFLFVPLALASLLLFPAVDHSTFAQSTTGLRIFETKCASCHQSQGANDHKAPDAGALRKMTPEAIYATFAKGAHAQIPNLSEENRKTVAEYLGGRPIGIAEIADAKAMPNRCATNSPMKDIATEPMWNGWGGDPATNARFQKSTAAGLTLAKVPNLKLRWAFGFPLAQEAHSQPTVVGGRVFVGSDAGTVYSLDAASACVYWSFQADGAMRVAASVGPYKGAGGTRYAAYFGDQKANMYAVDAQAGKLLWKVKVDEHPVAQITGSPTLYAGKLYVPMASSEERAAGMSSTYECCTFRGSVTALDANTGKQLWKTYIVPDPPKPTTKNAKGIQQYGPSGGAVWAAPTIDVRKRALYVGTGDSYSDPADKNTDAVMALNMDTGKIMWSVQDTQNDVWLAGCGGGSTVNPEGLSPNCPNPMGPDYDFGSSMILRTLPDGRRVLLAAQKSGMVWAHDPDNRGKLLWKAQVADKLSMGVITFGGAADDENAYFGLRSGGVAALSLETGQKKWFTRLPGAKPGDMSEGQTAALTVIPGVVFSGGWDGTLRALSTENGHVLWEMNTAHDYKTVNGVKAHGGTMAAAGPTIVGGRIFVGSGYLFNEGTKPGNVLLEFSAE